MAMHTVVANWPLVVCACLMVAALGVLLQMEVENDPVICTKTVALDKTRARVFQFISDLRNMPQWNPDVESFEPVDSAPMSIGKHFTETQYFTLYGEVMYNNIIIGYESPRFISYVTNNWMLYRIDITLERRESNSGQTALIYTIYTRRRSYLVKYCFAPVLRLITNGKLRQALFSLRFLFQNV